ncbi:MAG: ribosome maturation factor RimP [Selenomonadaceae bacterium]|nr:ribosome maturation factor RimP [Selenomonadaceae bacterium]
MCVANVVENAVWRIAEELLEGSGVELVDVEYVKEKDWYLRVFIDKPEGIGIEDCQALSEKLETRLDEQDVVPEAYMLEVSSPGLDRVLKKPRDFEREKGKAVEVSLYEPIDGEKRIVGTLESFDGEALILEGRSPIPKGKIAQVRLYIEI